MQNIFHRLICILLVITTFFSFFQLTLSLYNLSLPTIPQVVKKITQQNFPSYPAFCEKKTNRICSKVRLATNEHRLVFKINKFYNLFINCQSKIKSHDQHTQVFNFQILFLMVSYKENSFRPLPPSFPITSKTQSTIFLYLAGIRNRLPEVLPRNVRKVFNFRTVCARVGIFN